MTTGFVITPRKRKRRPRKRRFRITLVSTNRWRIRTPSVKNLEGVWNGVDAPEMCFDVYSNFGWPRINPATRKILGAVNPKKETSHWPMQIGSRWYTPVDHRSKTVDKGGSRPAPKHNTHKNEKKNFLMNHELPGVQCLSMNLFPGLVFFLSFHRFFSQRFEEFGVLTKRFCKGWNVLGLDTKSPPIRHHLRLFFFSLFNPLVIAHFPESNF